MILDIKLTEYERAERVVGDVAEITIHSESLAKFMREFDSVFEPILSQVDLEELGVYGYVEDASLRLDDSLSHGSMCLAFARPGPDIESSEPSGQKGVGNE